MTQPPKKDITRDLIAFTERVLTRRRAVLRVKKEKQKNKNQLLDWLEAFLWAAGWVLLVNQYLLQAYVIPSGSMIDTLLVGDRIIVNKLIYGPELLPGVAKLPSPVHPKRNQIIIFENPSYISKGLAFDIAQRIIFMLTVSLVDIDKDEDGNARAHFLIKRAVGFSGDTFINNRGNLLIKPAGNARAVPEAEFNVALSYNHKVTRLVQSGDYPVLEAEGRAAAFLDLNIMPPESLIAKAQRRAGGAYMFDGITQEGSRLSVLHAAESADLRYTAQLAKLRQGWYVADGYCLPLGDNRDNSRDGRYFGAVKQDKVLGRGVLKFWPFARIGVIK